MVDDPTAFEQFAQQCAFLNGQPIEGVGGHCSVQDSFIETIKHYLNETFVTSGGAGLLLNFIPFIKDNDPVRDEFSLKVQKVVLQEASIRAKDDKIREMARIGVEPHKAINIELEEEGVKLQGLRQELLKFIIENAAVITVAYKGLLEARGRGASPERNLQSGAANRISTLMGETVRAMDVCSNCGATSH